jgi:predicted ribosomally synthesized peptide with SipW-like signal peptide
MVVSLGAMGASAAFTDTDDSDYGVAIDSHERASA